MVCPRCGFEREESADECPRCGVVFARLGTAGIRRPPPSPASGAPGSDPDAPGEIDREGWRSLGLGLAVAVVVIAVPFLSFVFSYFVVLVHELGHAATAWLFGYPSLPAFDFGYGGGVTVHESRQVGLVALAYAGAALLIWLCRSRRIALAAIAGLVVLYSILAWTPAHEALILAMGHAAELLFAGIFLYRAISGVAIRVRAERPAYAFVGFFTLLFDLRFAVRLIASPDQRALYEEAKGGGHFMDLSRLADDYLHAPLAGVAFLFLICCLLPPVLAYLAHHYRPRLAEGAARVLGTA